MAARAAADRKKRTTMRASADRWYIKPNQEGGPRKIFGWRRREVRRRGLEDFLHDTDNFELTLGNLKSCPGSRKKKKIRCRGQYGPYGRSFGRGRKGAMSKTNKEKQPWFEGNATPFHIRVPKLTARGAKYRDSVAKPNLGGVNLRLSLLNGCDDGDEVDYYELKARGFFVGDYRSFKLNSIRICGDPKKDPEFKVKNLIVYAHQFEPYAREQIEQNGGKCIILNRAGLPIEQAEEQPTDEEPEEVAAEPEEA